MIKAIIHYNDVDDEFRRMHDILGVLKYKYKNIDISNEKLDCHHGLEFYIQTVEYILNKDV